MAKITEQGPSHARASRQLEATEPSTASEETPAPPARSARKSEWVAYANALGVDPAGKTKDELIDELGTT